MWECREPFVNSPISANMDRTDTCRKYQCKEKEKDDKVYELEIRDGKEMKGILSTDL